MYPSASMLAALSLAALPSALPPSVAAKPSIVGLAAHDDRGKYDLSYTWFEQNLANWEELTAPLRGRALNILEIGSFEGGSTTWLLDNLMDHPDSRLTTIDTFGGGNESAPTEYDTSDLERRFWHNIKLAKNAEKLQQIKAFSHDALVELSTERAEYDFIYVDGSHMAFDVLEDAVLSWRMLKEGGKIVFDDYHWDLYRQEYYTPNLAISSFLRCVAPMVHWFDRNGQVWATKVPNLSPPERRF